MPAPSSALPPLERTLSVSTPEHVAIGFPLAGLGSRFTALLADFVVMLVAWAVPVIALGLLAAGFDLFDGWGAGLAVLWTFAVMWGYFFVFEAFRDGQTPGKRMLSIRTVMQDGTPVTLRAAAVRSLLRILDVQPGVFCLVGGFSMLVSDHNKRLGDLAAGTVVVRELPVAFPDVVETQASDAAAPRLDDATFAALETFAERQGQLGRDAALSLARPLVQRIDPLASRAAGEGTVDYLLRVFGEESARRQSARMAVAAGSAAAVSLLRGKRATWEAFHDDVRRLRGRELATLGEQGVVEFAARYREVSADLARARTYGASARTIYALERIAGAAHNVFYRAGRRSAGKLRAFLTAGFPRLVRRLWRPLALSSALLYVPAVVAYLVVTSHPEYESMLAGVGLVERADRAAADPNSSYVDTFEMPWMGSGNLASQLIANNVRVSFLAFASGLLAGLGTVCVLVFNGLHLGSALAVFANRGVLDSIGMFVLPHGVIELTAITIAGAAGLWMGSGLYLPGRATRGRAVTERAKQAVMLVVGVAFLLVVAGIIEGFISPAKIPDAAKLLAAAAAATWLVLYLTVGGRREQPVHDALRASRAP